MSDEIRKDEDRPPPEPAAAPAAVPDPDSGWRSGYRHAAIVAVAVVLVAVAALIYWNWQDHSPEPMAAPGAGAPTPVTIMTVEERTVELRPSYLGRTQASQTVEIRPRVNGFLEVQAFEEGTLVEAGQLLYRIDPRPFEAEVAVAEARLVNAEARLERATRQVERFQEAAQARAASVSELDEWETERQVAQADVMLERARLEQAKLDLGYTSIDSPITGVIGESLVDVGSYVQAGGEGVLATVQQMDPIDVVWSVSEQEYLRWQRMAQSGAVQVPNDGRASFEVQLADGRVHPEQGWISFVGVQVDPTTGTARIRGTIPNPQRTLLPGQFVHARVLGIQRIGTLVVPQRALVQTPTGSAVFVVNSEGVAVQREVVPGDWTSEGIVIEQGLNAGDRVIVDGLTRVRPGTPVQAQDAPPAEPAAQAGGPESVGS